MFRVGLGQDSHRIKLKFKNAKLKIAKDLILGGVKVSSEYYSVANSDGDVVLHALCNALGQAVGESSLGVYATHMAKEGIKDSKKYVFYIYKKVKEKGYKVNNVGVMVEAQKPKLEKHSQAMKENISHLLDINIVDVGVTFTTGENLTSFGRGEGIQAFAIVSLLKNE